MTHNVNQLAEQHILEHEARLKHLDEILERADQGIESVSGPAEFRQQLKELHEAREELAQYLDEMKQISEKSAAQENLEKMGPMMIWETVAKKLEKLVEHIGH